VLPNEQDLLKKFLALRERVHSLFEEAVPPMRTVSDAGFHSAWSPPVDLYETETEFVLLAELPGVDKDDLDLQIVDRMIMLRGERHSSRDVCGQNYHRLERPFGRFERRLELPEPVDSSAVKAKMGDGVLTVTVPKKKARRDSIKVEVNKK
jgi:HSP20 family protein